jgi:hypothetical protein
MLANVVAVAVPDSNTVIAWGTAIATLIVIIRQQINAQAGKARGDAQAIKINEMHTATTNGQLDILRSRALAFRALANAQSTPENIKNALDAENDFVTYLKGLGSGNGATT